MRREKKLGKSKGPQGRENLEKTTTLATIKLIIASFQGRSDWNAYWEWDKTIELLFDCHYFYEERKLKLATIEFIDYAIVWCN